MKSILKNWKTTTAGVSMIAGAIILYLNDKTKIPEALLGLMAGIGLILGADSSSTTPPASTV
jgi:hypothetical protein